MKTEDLQKLGLTEDQIKEVHKLNGIDIEVLKTKNAVLESQKEELETQLQTANEQVERFKDINPEEIEKEIEDYKEKIAEVEKQNEEKLKDLELTHAIDLELANRKARNPKAVKALLDLESLKMTNEFTDDLKEQLDSLVESDGYLFDDGKPSGAIGGSKTLDDTISKEDFDKMDYHEKRELYNRNVELYRKLAN